jgi:hypothetical protein
MSASPLPDPTPRQWARHEAESHRTMAKHYISKGRPDFALVFAVLALEARMEAIEDALDDIDVSIGTLP